MTNLLEALESLDAVANFDSPSDVTAKITVHHPIREVQESFLKRFGFESYDYIDGSINVKGFYAIRVNKHIVLYSQFQPPCEHGLPDPAISKPVVAFAVAYGCFSGNCESNIRNPFATADISLHYQISVHGATPEQVVRIAQKHSLPILPQEHKGSKWLSIGETLIIFLEK